MNQAEVTKLVSKLKIKVNPRLRKFRNPKGPEERLNRLRKTVTALVKHERIELNLPRADEARMYAERLISDAIRYGDCHKTTMEMADYWLVEKQQVHKLFKVLVPRFQNYTVSCTRMYKAPHGSDGYRKAVLELRGNPYPPLVPDMQSNRNLIHNLLLDEAKKAYRTQKYKEIANKISEAEAVAETNKNDVKIERIEMVKTSESDSISIDKVQDTESSKIEQLDQKKEQSKDNMQK